MQIEIDDETVRLVWARGLSQLHILAVAEGGFEGATERACGLFGHMLPDFGHYAFEAVPDAAPGARETVLRLRISRSLERDVALRAFYFLDCHGRLQH